MKKFGRSLAVIVLALGGFVGTTHAVTLQDYQDKPLTNAADLALLCGAKPDGAVGTAALNFCHGFARGAVAAHLQREAASRRPLKLFCFPSPSPAPGPTLDAFAAWVKENPAQGNQKPVDGLFHFLGMKFPCGK